MSRWQVNKLQAVLSCFKLLSFIHFSSFICLSYKVSATFLSYLLSSVLSSWNPLTLWHSVGCVMLVWVGIKSFSVVLCLWAQPAITLLARIKSNEIFTFLWEWYSQCECIISSFSIKQNKRTIESHLGKLRDIHMSFPWNLKYSLLN